VQSSYNQRTGEGAGAHLSACDAAGGAQSGRESSTHDVASGAARGHVSSVSM